MRKSSKSDWSHQHPIFTEGKPQNSFGFHVDPHRLSTSTSLFHSYKLHCIWSFTAASSTNGHVMKTMVTTSKPLYRQAVLYHHWSEFPYYPGVWNTILNYIINYFQYTHKKNVFLKFYFDMRYLKNICSHCNQKIIFTISVTIFFLSNLEVLYVKKNYHYISFEVFYTQQYIKLIYVNSVLFLALNRKRGKKSHATFLLLPTVFLIMTLSGS